MRITLDRLTISNFKGLKSFEVGFTDQTTIKGANGTGKTTVFDAFLWLLFGKDSAGRKDFEVRPLDSKNQVRPGLEVAVEAAISFDGETHILRKEQHEKKVKGIIGYETECYIDEVPKKVGEYAEWIAERVPEDTFKTLTDLHYFNEKLHWKERRAILLSIAGPVGTPKGFDALLAALNGRSIEDYRKVIQGQRVQLVKDRDEIGPRIDEIQRAQKEYVGVNEKDLNAQRTRLMLKKQTLDADLKTILDSEQARQTLIDQKNALRQKQSAREAELANDTTGVSHLLKEKQELDIAVSNAQQAVILAKGTLANHERIVELARQDRDRLISARDALRIKYTEANEVKAVGTCYACGQKLPADKLAEAEKREKEAIAKVKKDLVTARDAAREATAKVEELEKLTAEHKESVSKADIKLDEARQYQAERLIVIDPQIKGQKKVDPKDDTAWKNLQTEIEALDKQIGGPTGGKMAEIRTQVNQVESEIEVVNRSLAQADRNKKDVERVKELSEQEKDLSKRIALVDQQIDDIGKYQKAESELIEGAVNHLFRYVRFKLFNYLLNGSIEPCCEAMLDGVPYSDCSYGQKIRMGMDINNILSKHYDLSVPMFLDNSESLTYPIETGAQVICLCADSNVTELTTEIAEAVK